MKRLLAEFSHYARIAKVKVETVTMAANPTILPLPKTRTASDVTTLWVELARAIKGYRFYPRTHPQLQAILHRSFRTWRADLDRHGTLEAVLHGKMLRLVNSSPITSAHSDELAREFTAYGVCALGVTPAMTQDGFQALLEIFSDTEFAATTHAKRQACIRTAAEHGVEITLGRPAHTATAAQEEQSDVLDLLDMDSPSCAEINAEIGHADPALLLAALLEPEALDTSTLESVGSINSLSAAPPPNHTPAKQALRDQRRASLKNTLSQFEKAKEDSTYECLAAEAIATAKLLFEDGDSDAAYQTILALSTQAAQDSENDTKKSRCASEALISFASGPQLADLIARACSADTSLRIRATQILLQLAEHAVPALLRSIETLQDPNHRSQVAGILIAIGERATPHLLRTMQGNNLRAARVATRLAGEIQNPAAVSTLRKLMTSSDPALAKEASKALVLIGDSTAIGALIHALLHETSAVATQAAYWLGKTQSTYALQPLADIAQQATQRGDFELAQEAVRALGQIALLEAVPALLFVLEQRSFFKRQKMTELKLVALQALANIPGNETRNLLLRFAEGEDPIFKREAQHILRKRAQGRAVP